MKKLNSVMYHKLILQAEEAKAQGMTKLAEGILEAIGDEPNTQLEDYSYGEFQDDVHRDLWKIATRFMYYWDVQSASVEKVDQAILSWASKLSNSLEEALGVDNVIVGPLEPKLPGEDK